MLILIFNLILGLCCPIKQQLNTSSDPQLVPTDAKRQNNMTKERFLEIIQWFEDQYQSEVKEHAAELKIYTDWEQPIANAVAQRENNLWIIRVFGGIARHRLVT